MKTFDDRLQSALAAMEDGATLEQALAAVPEQEREALRELLQLARAIQRVEHPQPAAANLAALTRRVPDTQRPPLTRQVYALAVTALTILIFVGLFVFRPLRDQIREETASDGPRIVVTATPQASPDRPRPTPTPTPTTPAESRLRLGDAPLLRNGTADDWDAILTEPFALLEDESTLYMYRLGQQADGYYHDIGLSTADRADPADWQSVSPDPVLSAPEWAEYIQPGGSVIRGADGRWMMFLTLGGDADYFTPTAFYRATASAPQGPWTVDPAPLLSASEEGWDSERILTPVLLQFDDLWYLFYTGTDVNHRQAIGVATSPDGLRWNRLLYPVLTRANIAHSEGDVLTLLDVIVRDGTFIMLYRIGATLNPAGDVYGLAFSSDGMQWEVDQTPLLDRRDWPSARVLYDAEMRALPSGGLELYFGMATGAGISGNIWQAEFDLP